MLTRNSEIIIFTVNFLLGLSVSLILDIQKEIEKLIREKDSDEYLQECALTAYSSVSSGLRSGGGGGGQLSVAKASL